MKNMIANEGGVGIGSQGLAEWQSSNRLNPIAQCSNINPNIVYCLLSSNSGGKGFGGGNYDRFPCKHLADVNSVLDRFDAFVNRKTIHLYTHT